MARPATTPTQRQVAEALGIDPALVSRHKKLGMPVDSIRAALEWRTQNIAARAPTPPSAGKGAHAPNYAVSRAMRMAAEAGLASLLLAEEKGDLVRVDAVMAQIATALASTRDALMQIPARLATVIASESDPGRVRTLLGDELRHALGPLAAAQRTLQQPNLEHFEPGATRPAAPLPAPSSDRKEP